MTDIKPGCTVRHKVKRHDDSDFVGWVDEIITKEGIGYTYRTVHVRWIQADDDPSGNTTTHSPEELVVVKGEGP